MPHNRFPRPGSRYYLPKYKYRYVTSFCMTYRDLKKELHALDGWHSHESDGMPHGTGKSDPTASEAMKREKISRKIDLIEGTVMEQAGKVLYPMILEAVTRDDISLEQLKAKYNIPIDKRQYTTIRRRIFYEIDQSL